MSAILESRWVPVEDSDYCNASNAAEVLGVTGAFLGAALLAIALRFYVRIRILKFVGAEDWTMLAAGLLGVGVLVCFVGESFWGVGRHNRCVPLGVLWGRQMQWEFVHGLCIVPAVVLVKISVAFFLMRLAPKKTWRIFLWGSIAFLVCFAVSCLGTLIFQCTPIDAAWKPILAAQPTTRCYSKDTYSFIGLFNSIVNICTDVLFAVLPIPIIIKLQVNLRTKITLGVILSLGFVACAAGIAKATLQVKFFADADGFWHDSFNVLNMVELCLGILAASLPSLKPLFSQLLEGTRTAFGRSNGSRKASHTPVQYPGVVGGSGGSGGRKQPYNPRAFNEMLEEVDLQDYSKDPNATIIEYPAQAAHAAGTDQVPSTKKIKPYGVRITSGSMTREKNSDEEGLDLARSESQERLHQPSGGIYRTMEITRTSERM
ncbi:hypothetical protein LTR27_011680 [Elasticomyces elasticus]|nr:hypothetical protein LTR27_011680 [Elasticomyces elasticus]